MSEKRMKGIILIPVQLKSPELKHYKIKISGLAKSQMIMIQAEIY
jgi:hypothetical protein